MSALWSDDAHWSPWQNSSGLPKDLNECLNHGIEFSLLDMSVINIGADLDFWGLVNLVLKKRLCINPLWGIGFKFLEFCWYKTNSISQALWYSLIGCSLLCALLLPKDLLNPKALEHFHRIISFSTIELFLKVLKLISLVRALLGDTSKPQKNFWNDLNPSQFLLCVPSTRCS